MSNLDIVKYLKENATDNDGNIVLDNLDFGDEYVFITGLKAKGDNFKRKSILYYRKQRKNERDIQRKRINEY